MNKRLGDFIFHLFVHGTIIATALLLLDIISDKHLALMGFLSGTFMLGSLLLWYKAGSQSRRDLFIKHCLIGGIFWVLILTPLMFMRVPKDHALLATLAIYAATILVYYVVVTRQFT